MILRTRRAMTWTLVASTIRTIVAGVRNAGPSRVLDRSIARQVTVAQPITFPIEAHGPDPFKAADVQRILRRGRVQVNNSRVCQE